MVKKEENKDKALRVVIPVDESQRRPMIWLPERFRLRSGKGVISFSIKTPARIV